jgi:hypothetical protein
MREQDRPSIVSEDTSGAETGRDLSARWQKVVRRRAFLIGMAGAGAALPAGRLFADEGSKLSKGDAALLQFALAAEIIESDLWQQYNELGGAVDHKDNPNPGNPAYVAALSNLDSDMPQYISDNTDDEISHRDFLTAYLRSKGVTPVDLSQFANLPSVTTPGAAQTGRITNLTMLNVDTSWYFRYRSTQSPDLGAVFPQVINIAKQPAIPLNNSYATSTIQAIANVAAIHFAFIEQGGSSLYPILALKATDAEVLRILLSIGGVEIDHFSLWHDKMGNAFSTPVAPLMDPVTKLTFPNLNDPGSQSNPNLSAADKAAGSQMFQTNLILPEPCEFLSANLPPCSVIRPTLSEFGGPMAAAKGFIADNLFMGQPPAFFEMVMDVAAAAEAVRRGDD